MARTKQRKRKLKQRRHHQQTTKSCFLNTGSFPVQRYKEMIAGRQGFLVTGDIFMAELLTGGIGISHRKGSYGSHS